MIDRLLIANRGEIAVRVARTAHRMGIDIVGVYSEPDANSLHVDVVDVAVALGGATPAESYLRGDAIIAAALATGADAIHPGYGFLAENADFAQSVVDAGLTWVGPTPEQIRLLGDKVAAKKRAIEAGVPTAALFEIVDGELLTDVPLPALVKAAAGGGGRGMRVVRTAGELADAVEAGSREALSAFGDGTVFVEPYIERARHIEVQVMGDKHGNVVHLGERECSIQRRNQKIVEESPSAGIDHDVRQAICEGAVALAADVGYHGAGTVEFMVAEDGTINFLEVNTRLQVEHPVTEAVTGLDLVELQLRVASGEPLPVSQDDINFDGHAIEVRVVAEDPSQGWLPSTGVVSHFEISDGVRVDTGVRAGATISSDYDSLIAKVIAHAPTRDAAARKMKRALRSSLIAGVETDVDALVAIMGEDDYLAAATPTAYLDEHAAVVAPCDGSDPDRVALVVAATLGADRASRLADGATSFAPSGWRNLAVHGQRVVWQTSWGPQPVEYRLCPANRVRQTHETADFLLGPWPEPAADGSMPDDERVRHSVRRLSSEDGREVVEVDRRRWVVDVEVARDRVVARSAMAAAVFDRVPRFVDHDAEEAGSGPVCPLPGTVLAVHVEAGDRVADGQLLMVVEAMKMEHKITATGAAVVTEVRFAEGDRVDAGDLLVALDHDAES